MISGDVVRERIAEIIARPITCGICTSKLPEVQDKIDEAVDSIVKLMPDMSDGICYYCGKKTNNLSANPSEWSIPLCHKDEPGKVKHHHIGCVSERLVENQPIICHCDDCELERNL